MTRYTLLTERVIGKRTVLACSTPGFSSRFGRTGFFSGMRLLVSLAYNIMGTNPFGCGGYLPKLETTCPLEAFRGFMITSTCRSFIPNDYQLDAEVFPERSRGLGTMYVEAEDKVTLGRVNDISFVKVNYVLGIIYNSKSRHTELKWRHVRGDQGRLSGEASTNTMVNLYETGALDRSFIRPIAARIQ